MLLWGTHHKSLQQTHVYSRSNVSMHLLMAWHQPLACYIPAKHENNLCRSLQIAAKTDALFRKALNHLFSSCSTQKVFKDMNFNSSLTCVVSLYAQNIIPPCAFFLVYIRALSLPLFKPIAKCFQSFYLKVEGNDGIRDVFWVPWII